MTDLRTPAQLVAEVRRLWFRPHCDAYRQLKEAERQITRLLIENQELRKQVPRPLPFYQSQAWF